MQDKKISSLALPSNLGRKKNRRLEMSKKEVKTEFGYDGPFFPEEVKLLNQLQDKSKLFLNKKKLEKVAKKIRDFIFVGKHNAPMTKDGYRWFWALYFQPFSGDKNREIAVFFPYATDNDKKNGISLDRSIAVYTSGEVTRKEINKLLANLGESISLYS